MTLLCDLAEKYRTDKCPSMGHSYTPYYYELLKDKRYKFKKVLEIGIGYPTLMKHCEGYITGASLFMWQEFFPKAQIYGVDIAPESIFQADRIKTFLYDTTDKDDIMELVEQIGTDIDLVIDDGCHHDVPQTFLARTLLPMLKQDVIYIIEDVFTPQKKLRHYPEYNVINPKLDQSKTYYRKRRWRDELLVITKK